MREKDGAAFAASSPHAAALPVLLDALGIRLAENDVADALPHFSDTFGITELRNMLLALGYTSQRLRWKPKDIDPRLFPCLFEPAGGGLWVLLEEKDDVIGYYDAMTDTLQETALDQTVRGTAYIFTALENNPASVEQKNFTSWGKSLLNRFLKTGLYLIAITFLIDIIALTVPLSIMFIYDTVIAGRSLDTLGYLIAGIMIVFSVDFGLRKLRAKTLGYIAGRMDYLIGVETFAKLLRLPPLFTERSSVVAQLMRLKQFDGIRDFITGHAAGALLELPFFFLGTLVIFIIAGPLAWVPIMASFVYMIMYYFASTYLTEAQQRHGMLKSQKQSMMIQTIEGLSEIKNSGGKDAWCERLRKACAYSAAAGYRDTFLMAAFTSLGQLISSLSILSIIVWGAFMVMEGGLTSGGLIAVMAISWRLLTPLQTFCLSIPQASQVKKSLSHIDKLMKLSEEHNSKHTGRFLSDVRGEICMRRVAFRYTAEDDPAVLGVSLKIEAGELVAITGPSGSGKSTLLKLIAGMYQPQAGFIMLDGIDVRQIDPVELRRHIAYVPQNVKMFHGTLAQNLRLNHNLASDRDLEKALDLAGIFGEVKKLPAGLDTRIGDNLTHQFPPGFIHGLALARALVRPARILLLDEPAASLDMRTDHIFMRNLKRMRGRYTIVMVTHRPSHIKLADRAIYLNEGNIRFMGAPDKVVAHLMEQLT